MMYWSLQQPSEEPDRCESCVDDSSLHRAASEISIDDTTSEKAPSDWEDGSLTASFISNIASDDAISETSEIENGSSTTTTIP